MLNTVETLTVMHPHHVNWILWIIYSIPPTISCIIWLEFPHLTLVLHQGIHTEYQVIYFMGKLLEYLIAPSICCRFNLHLICCVVSNYDVCSWVYTLCYIHDIFDIQCIYYFSLSPNIAWSWPAFHSYIVGLKLEGANCLAN